MFYCQLCREGGGGGGGGGGEGGGGEGEGVGSEGGNMEVGEMLTWRKAVNDFMLQAFLKVHIIIIRTCIHSSKFIVMTTWFDFLHNYAKY